MLRRMVTPEDVVEAPPGDGAWFDAGARQAVVLIVAWKIAVLAVVFLGAYMLQPQAVYPANYEDAPGPSWGAFKNALHGFDTVHYVALAEDGYEKGNFRNAFYPALPYSMRALNLVTGDSIV